MARCGCRLEYQYRDRKVGGVHSPTVNSVNIVYCPLHTAAPDLLDAAQYALYHMADHDSIPVYEIAERLKSAIDKATDEESNSA